MNTHRTLFGEPLPVPMQNKAVAKTRAKFPSEFPNEEAARRFLRQVILPPSLRWSFVSVGKNASSSILRLLFKAEFGIDLTVSCAPVRDINPSAEIHMLMDYGVFSRALLRGLSLRHLLNHLGMERICVVRDPFARAISSFRYFCRSNEKSARWFARDRFRINAGLGFDWNKHPGTPEGFQIFLRYLQWEINEFGVDFLDAHWRPQFDFIKPRAFRPTLIGNVEDIGSFYKSLAERLGFPLPDTQIWENRQIGSDDDLHNDHMARKLCEEIYLKDYEWLNY
jgi:hypothetical protein